MLLQRSRYSITLILSFLIILIIIMNIRMSDAQCIQASISVRNGGLVIRCAASLALSAFLTSAAATVDLQCSIHSRCQLSVDKEVSTARTLWRSLIDTPCHWEQLNRLKELGMRPSVCVWDNLRVTCYILLLLLLLLLLNIILYNYFFGLVCFRSPHVRQEADQTIIN